MELFLSWSGDRSRKLAEAVRGLLVSLYGGRKIRTHLSADIAKGEPWSDALVNHLRASEAVLICLTPEALASTWITYEAGYIVGRTESPRVFTLLYEVTSNDIPDPLRSYQSTTLEPSDIRRLAHDMTGMNPDDARWAAAWREFDSEVGGIPPRQLHQIVPAIEEWFRRKTFDEPLHHCMDQSWIERYAGAVETRQRLRSVAERVEAAGAGFAAEVFHGLLGAVDSYATAIRGLLLLERPPFPTAPDGTLDFQTPGLLEALEARRIRVKTLLNAGVVLAPFAQPEAFLFERLETFAEKKDLIHRKRAELERDLATGLINEAMVSTWRGSEWDFDRISAYLVDAMTSFESHHDAVAAAEVELEKAQATEGGTLIPVHYALKAVEVITGRAGANDGPALNALLANASRFLESLDNHERTRGPAGVIARIRGREASPAPQAQEAG